MYILDTYNMYVMYRMSPFPSSLYPKTNITLFKANAILCTVIIFHVLGKTIVCICNLNMKCMYVYSQLQLHVDFTCGAKKCHE